MENKQVIYGTCPSKSNCYKIIKIGNISSLGKTPSLRKYEKDFLDLLNFRVTDSDITNSKRAVIGYGS